MQTHSQRTERLGLFACLTNWDANFPSQDHEDSKTGQSYLQLPGKLKLSRERVAQRLKHLPGMGDPGLIPGLGRSPGGGNGDPLQYSCLENCMDRGAWQYTVCGVEELDMTERTHSSMDGEGKLFSGVP